MIYKISGACKSVIGNVRENNEDNYYFNFKNLKQDNTGEDKISTMKFESVDNVVLSVFDGMGGESNGERASYLAANTLNKYLKDNVNNLFSWNDYVKLANKNICDEIYNNVRMGTTLAGIRFTENFFDICNLGDSKIFGLKNNNLVQISQDHTDENIQKKLNIAGVKSYKLTQHLGIKENEMTIVPYIKKFNYETYDKIVICSDGLTDMVSNNEIKKILSLNIKPKDIVDKLISTALKNGGKDNTTVIVLDIKKKLKSSYKTFIITLVIVLISIVLFLKISSNTSFKIINDEYPGALSIGDSYKFKYSGGSILDISNDNIEYRDNMIIAKKEGTSTITITDKKGNVLYTKTIKIFPN